MPLDRTPSANVEKNPQQQEATKDEIETPLSSRDEKFIRRNMDENVSMTTIFKLPPFWRQNPKIWFIQAEAQFHARNIRGDNTKYYQVIASLEGEVLEQVADVISSPPEEEKYQYLKQSLIKRFSVSKEKQLTRLLIGLELGEKKPSQLLREMNNLAESNLSEEALRSLWMRQLPANVRCILSASSGIDIVPLAEIADKIMDSNPAYTVLSTQAQDISEVSRSEAERINTLEEKITELTSAIKDLTRKVDQSRGRSRSRSKPTQKSEDKDSKTICYYHKRFGEKSNKCTKPCAYESKQEN
ncbi:uncharacterized protein [Prorops nasuta]|uniref:uncharacterized protein n=1 Tax=Prorops nasuta TaxID=863751 RepID=UPI0034CE0C62